MTIAHIIQNIKRLPVGVLGFVGIAVVAAAILVGVAPQKAAAAGYTKNCDPSNRCVIKRATNQSLCLDIHGADKRAGARLDQYRCMAGAQNQQFVIRPVSNTGYYQIYGYDSGKCLDNGYTTYNGAQVTQQWCGSNPLTAYSQHWFIWEWGETDQFSFMPRHNTKCLDAPGSSNQLGLAMIQFTCNGGYNQRWILDNVR